MTVVVVLVGTHRHGRGRRQLSRCQLLLLLLLLLRHLGLTAVVRVTSQHGGQSGWTNSSSGLQRWPQRPWTPGRHHARGARRPGHHPRRGAGRHQWHHFHGGPLRTGGSTHATAAGTAAWRHLLLGLGTGLVGEAAVVAVISHPGRCLSHVGQKRSYSP